MKVKSKSIMIVDDDIDVINLFKRELAKREIYTDVIAASDPVQALEKFYEYKNNISVVVTDYFMPIEDGLELASIIKQNKSSIQLFVLTARKDIKMDGRISNADRVFLKSNGLESPVRAIRDYFDDLQGSELAN